MKKRTIILGFFVLILILGVSFSSAFWPFDWIFKSKGSLTGKIIDNTPFKNSVHCSDTDGGIYSRKKGEVSYEREFLAFFKRTYKVIDRCEGKVFGSGVIGSGEISKLREYYCDEGKPISVLINCPRGCHDGECTSSCRDSDANATNPDGKNIFIKGLADSRIDRIGSYYEDSCLLRNQVGPRNWQYVKVDSCEGNDCVIQEGFCSNGEVNNLAYSCPDGMVCSNGACKKHSNNSTLCRGTIANGFCYMDYNKSLISHETFENHIFKIWANYSKKIPIGKIINFQMYIKNKLNETITFNYNYQFNSEHYTLYDTDFLTNHEAPKGGLGINIGPLQTKRVYANLIRNLPQKENFVIGEPLISIFPYYQTKLLSDGDLVFIEECPSGVSNTFKFQYQGNSALCVDNILYPSAECIKDEDCQTNKQTNKKCIEQDCQTNKKCIEQRCISLKYPLHNEKINKHLLAYGNKNLLFVSISSSYVPKPNSVCTIQFLKSNELPLFSTVESFYDEQAISILNRNASFINFNWTFIKVSPNSLGRLSENNAEILENVLSVCGINRDLYDFVVAESDPGIFTCGGPGCVISNKDIALTFLHSQDNSISKGNTLVHEINHIFGALDKYYLIGCTYQWDGDIQCSKSELRSNNPHLWLTRSEIGWVDLNENGVVDVEEDFATA